jgi:hypothetical protein
MGVTVVVLAVIPPRVLIAIAAVGAMLVRSGVPVGVAEGAVTVRVALERFVDSGGHAGQARAFRAREAEDASTSSR